MKTLGESDRKPQTQEKVTMNEEEIWQREGNRPGGRAGRCGRSPLEVPYILGKRGLAVLEKQIESSSRAVLFWKGWTQRMATRE